MSRHQQTKSGNGKGAWIRREQTGADGSRREQTGADGSRREQTGADGSRRDRLRDRAIENADH
ncbi:hypothetical protein JUNP479_3325 [Aeromonas jandaei]|nr:hypothetical protein JUNP479_3325 [Aeromonas jandaei]